MSLRTLAAALVWLISGTVSVSADSTTDPVSEPKNPLYANALGVDVAGFFYNQYLLNYERQIIEHLSISIAGGGSPAAEFLSPTFRYLYFQGEVRGYPLSHSLSGLYTGFGVGMTFADTLLDWSQWGIDVAHKGSTAMATYGEIGWKFIIPLNDDVGIFIDPNIYVYTMSPLSLSTVQTTEEKPFVYKPFSAMCYITCGLVF